MFMKVLKKFVLLYSLLFLISCASTRNQNINFYNESGSVIIQNETNEDILLFIGNIENNILLGGVKANSENHFDIKNIEGTISKGVFVARCILYSDYIEKKDITDNDVFYQTIITFDTNDSSYRSHILIPSIIDTSRKYGVITRNETEYIMNIRYESPQGPIVASLLPFESNKKVYLRESTTPVSLISEYRYINPITNEIFDWYSSRDSSRLCLPDSINDAAYLTFPKPEIDLTSEGFSCCELEIRNLTEYGFQVIGKSSILQNIHGKKICQPGKIDCYEINEGEQQFLLYFDNNKELRIHSYFYNKNHKYSILISYTDGEFDYKIVDTGKIIRNMFFLFE